MYGSIDPTVELGAVTTFDRMVLVMGDDHSQGTFPYVDDQPTLTGVEQTASNLHARHRIFVHLDVKLHQREMVTLLSLPQPLYLGVKTRRQGNSRSYRSNNGGGFRESVGILRAESILRLSQGPTSVDVPLSKSQLEHVKGALVSIINVFSEKQVYGQQVGSRPKRWDSVDIRIEADTAAGIGIDLFCNPNACSNAFEARVLVTIQVLSSDLRVVTEVGLEELKQSYTSCISENPL